MMKTPQRTSLITLSLMGLLGLLGLLGALSGLALGGLALLLAGFGMGATLVQHQRHVPVWSQREQEALNLLALREREEAFYHLAGRLSATLKHQDILTSALQIGQLATKAGMENARHVSAALLFEEGNHQLKVVASRGLTRNDEALTPEGKRGVLGLALTRGQDEPVFDDLPEHDPELTFFAGFQGCRSIMVLPLRSANQHFGVLMFGSSEPHAFSDAYVDMLKAISKLAAISLQNAVLYQNLQAEKERLVDVEEDARKKLARDLHDGPTQSVTVIAMRVNYVKRIVDKQPQQAIEQLNEVEELARRTTKEIRHMLFTLRPLILETQGLVAALQQLSEKIKEDYGLNVKVEAQPGADRWLDQQAQDVLFYIIDEAVTNARKHAQSENLWIRLRKVNELLRVEIEDDGVGFDVDSMRDQYRTRGSSSLGMINMEERTEMIQGSFDLHSRVGEGTRITIHVPVREGSLARLTSDMPAIPGLEDPSAPANPKRPSGIRPISPLPAQDPPTNPQAQKNIPFAGKRSPNS
ncbi:MAG: GAF domain-containing sensor histidine kinase [Anaerolineae bacterium]|nr:GAF domain-containing sensor histidine kinase [Anaerolineae bacterium]